MKVQRAGISTAVLAVVAIVVVGVLVATYFLVAGSLGNGTGTTGQQQISLQFNTPLQLEAGGSSFVNPVMQSWTFQFQNLTNDQVKIDYQPVGSGAGIQGIFANLYDFAGSDAPVPPSELAANATGRTLLQIPEALGAVAIFYNIPGVHQSLNLSGTVLEQIYLQGITKWDDPAITTLNPRVSLPDQTIVPVHRSDGSGTTFAITTYFSRIDPSWTSKVGVGTTVNWPNAPNAELAAKGSGGVAALVNETGYSVGYADSFYAASNGLNTAAIENSAGSFIRPSIASVGAAASALSSQVQQNVTYSITDAPGSGSYPISTFTYILVWATQTNSQKADAIAVFLWWVVHQGQIYSPRLFYASLPSQVVTIDENLIHQITYNGQSYEP